MGLRCCGLGHWRDIILTVGTLVGFGWILMLRMVMASRLCTPQWVEAAEMEWRGGFGGGTLFLPRLTLEVSAVRLGKLSRC